MQGHAIVNCNHVQLQWTTEDTLTVPFDPVSNLLIDEWYRTKTTAFITSNYDHGRRQNITPAQKALLQ